MDKPARIVIAGGGVAALEAAIALRALAGPQPWITLVAPNDHFVYQPLTVAEPFAMGDTPRLPLSAFAEDLDIEWRQAAVESIGSDRAVLLEGGGFVAWDKLIVAMGAPRVAVYDHATTFRGENDVQAVHGLVQDVEMGVARRVAFVVPAGVAWSLPLYELALMTARRAFEMNMDVELTLITPEDRPLGVFGAAAANDVEDRLASAGIELHTRTVAEIPAKGQIVLRPGGGRVECDRIIALPISRGPDLKGLPADAGGFIPIDTFARVSGVENVYAAGDGANFPLKQGGLACQQADAAAEHIAWSLGLLEHPEPFRPVLRGELLTGDKPQFMRRDVTARREGAELSGDRPLWWPATKIAGRYLSAYLAGHDRSPEGSEQIAPGIRRRAFLSPASDDVLEIPLRGYEYSRHWAETGTP
jgi:sulfide:quinone oxidoreductase